jgi:PAS domain S-box-containing protein
MSPNQTGSITNDPRLRRKPRRRGRAVLRSVGQAAAAFVGNPSSIGIPDGLRRLGLATGVGRVWVVEAHRQPDGRLLHAARHEWTAPGIPRRTDDPHLRDVSFRDVGLGRWEQLLAAGRPIHGVASGFADGEREFLRSRGVLSVALVPIMVEDAWWGYLGFDDCAEERRWSPAVLATLRTAADLFGAMITRRDLEERLRCLAAATTEGILFHDGATILDGNQRLAQLVDLPLTEIIGQDPFRFLAPEYRDLAREHALNDTPEPYEVRVVRRDGSQFPALVQGRRLPYRGREARVVAVRDITWRKEAQENERRLAREQAARRDAEAAERRAEFLAEVSRVLASSLDTSTTLWKVAQLAVPYLAARCAVDIVQDGRLRRIASAAVGPGAEPPPAGHADEPSGGAVLERDRVLAGETVLIRRVPGREVLGLGADAAEPWDCAAVSGLLVPIRARDQVVGIMSFLSVADEREYRAEDRELAEELAGRTGMALEHARLFDEAQAAVRTRDEVLSVVTHDLRNPLGVILGGAATLLELQPEGVQRRLCELISSNALRMDRMVNDLLEVARADLGRLALDLVELPVEALVAEAGAMMRPLAEAQGIGLETETAPSLPVRADSGRVLQVLSNLIGNAVKFTPAGGSIRLECVPIGGEACFMVSDTGPGIPPDQIPHLFGAFWQADSLDRRGLGLGLSIARGIVEAHGGRIWVESQVGAGSTFFFTLPHVTASGAEPPGDAASA